MAATLGLQNKNAGGIIQLTTDERRALNEYISSGSYKINEVLRKGTGITKDDKEYVKQMDAVLNKLPVYQGTVYRSLDSAMMIEGLFWEEHKVGNTVTYPAYTSSSTTVYDESMDIQMIIQSKTGVDMRKYNPSEQEILFARNSKFEVIKREGRTLWLKEI